MPPRKEHPAKGWACVLDRSSRYVKHVKQHTHDNQDRINNETLRSFGLKLRPNYRFSETGVSASKSITRKDLEKAINAIVKEKVVEALVVQDVTRLTREGARHMGEMLDAVDAVGGRIIFARGPLDSSVSHNRAIIAFMAEQAREEAQTLAWRIGNWREGSRIKGEWTGKRPYGLLVVDGKLTPHPDEAPIIRRIVDEVHEGRGLGSIAVALNKEGVLSPAASKAREMVAAGREPKQTDTPWTRQAVARVLHNPALVGWQSHNGRVALGADGDPVIFGEGILEPGEHARVLAELERRTAIVHNNRKGQREEGSKTGGGRLPRHLLVGLIRCSACGYAMDRVPAYRRVAAHYRCGTLACGAPCPARAYVPIDEADEEVMNQLRNRLAELEPDDPILEGIAERWREVMMPEGEGERGVLQNRLDAVRGRIVDLDEARWIRGDYVTPEDVTRWGGMMERLKLQRDAVQDELDALGPPPDFNLDALRATYRREAWDAMAMPERRRWLQVAVTKVLATKAHSPSVRDASGRFGRREAVPASERIRVILVGEEGENAQ